MFLASKERTPQRAWARVDHETKALSLSAAKAKTKEAVLRYLVVHLRGGESSDEEDARAEPRPFLLD